MSTTSLNPTTLSCRFRRKCRPRQRRRRFPPTPPPPKCEASTGRRRPTAGASCCKCPPRWCHYCRSSRRRKRGLAHGPLAIALRDCDNCESTTCSCLCCKCRHVAYNAAVVAAGKHDVVARGRRLQVFGGCNNVAVDQLPVLVLYMSTTLLQPLLLMPPAKTTSLPAAAAARFPRACDRAAVNQVPVLEL